MSFPEIIFLVTAIMLTITTAATPLLLAAIGELVVERSGVLNLGVEGMIVIGAVVAFVMAQITGNATWVHFSACWEAASSLCCSGS